MENTTSCPKALCLANLTNKRVGKDAQTKRMAQNRFKKLLLNSLQREDETENQNVNVSFNPERLGKAGVSEDLSAGKPALTKCPGVARTLKKVNVDYFLGKRVQFRHANVRISFEIVDSLL